MVDVPKKDLMTTIELRDIPNLISFWNFNQSGEEFITAQGEPYSLRSQTGRIKVVEDKGAAFGGKALELEEGQWLSILREDCPKLDIHGKDGELTLIAWVKRSKTIRPQCEFIAGQWNESNFSRQYGLFLNISVWGPRDRIFGHLSMNGGPTPGYKYCMDGCMGSTNILYDEWVSIGMSYDGHHGYAWLNGLLDGHSTLNPYPLSGGLNDGGQNGSDFTVGAVDRAGEIGNFFCGKIAGLAVFNRALTPAEIYATSNAGK